MANPRLCSIPECGKPSLKRGYCSAHYLRWYHHGEPLGGGTSPGAAGRYLLEVVLPYDGDDCLTWPFGRNGKGYGSVRVNGRPTLVHRLSCEAEHGPPPSPLHQAAHSCGKGHLGCVTKRHLRWATYAENRADMLIHDTRNRGPRNGSAKLTAEQVHTIRMLKGMHTEPAIAAMFGVSRGAVNGIHRRKSWAWLK